MKIAELVLLFGLGLTTSAHAVSANIPSSFRGFWEEAEMCQIALEMGTPDTGAIIKATEVNGYEQDCEVKEVIELAQDAIEIRLECMDSEGSSMSTLELRSFDNKYLVISRDGDKTSPLVRCE